MAPFPTPTLTVLAVLITSLESPFSSWITNGFSVACVVIGAAVVMRTVTTYSGRGFMVQARFAGDGSIYLRRQ